MEIFYILLELCGIYMYECLGGMTVSSLCHSSDIISAPESMHMTHSRWVYFLAFIYFMDLK